MQNDGEQIAVDVVAIAFRRERLAQQPSAGSVVGGLEPAQKLVERVHHLLGEALAHLALVLAAVFQERGEPLAAGQCERPAVRLMCTTRKSIQPEPSPRGAEMRRSAVTRQHPLTSRPVTGRTEVECGGTGQF